MSAGHFSGRTLYGKYDTHLEFFRTPFKFYTSLGSAQRYTCARGLSDGCGERDEIRNKARAHEGEFIRSALAQCGLMQLGNIILRRD